MLDLLSDSAGVSALETRWPGQNSIQIQMKGHSDTHDGIEGSGNFESPDAMQSQATSNWLAVVDLTFATDLSVYTCLYINSF